MRFGIQFPTFGEVADATILAEYLQMPEGFVERELRLDNLDALYIGYDWRMEPPASAQYVEARRTVTPLMVVDLD